MNQSTRVYCEQADVTAGTCPLVGLLTKVLGPWVGVADDTAYTYYASDDSSCVSAPTACPHRKGDLYKVTHAGGLPTTYLTYDAAGRPLRTSDPNGVFTDYTYSLRGRLTQSAVRGIDNAGTSDDAITTIVYEPTGTVSKVTQPDGDFLSYTYDTAHRLTDVVDNLGNNTHYTLDNAGNRTREDSKDSAGTLSHTQSRVFDQLGRLQKALNASGLDAQATLFSYDANDNPSSISDPLHTTNQAFDKLNRLTSTTQDVGGLAVLTKTQYNALDQVTQVTDPKNLNTTYTYNGLGEMITQVSPDTGTTRFTYGPAHELRSRTDARNIIASYTYDALYRPSSVTYPTPALNVTYVYDTLNAACQSGESYPLGHLTKFTDSSGNTQFCYDRFGNLTRKVQVNGALTQTTRFEYTMAGRLYRVTYPSRAQALFGRNATGQVQALNLQLTPTSALVPVINGISYYPFGPLKQIHFVTSANADLRWLTKYYDADYKIDNITDGSAGGFNADYGVDPIGNVTSIVSRINGVATTRNYTYDGLDRLKTALTPGVSSLDERFTYDGTGDRQSKQIGAGAVQTYTYPSTSHQLTAVSGVTRALDLDGSTTSFKSGANTLSFTYDDRERVQQSLTNGTASWNFKYNARGERVAKLNPSTTSTVDYNFVYDEAGHLLGEYNRNDGAYREYVWADDTLVAVIAASDGSTAGYQIVETDHLGTPRAIIDPVRNVPVWRWSVVGKAFGEDADEMDPDGNGTLFWFYLRFPGQYSDGQGRTNYNYFRDYDPATGRYIESDPIGLKGGMSTYGYVGGNPTRRIDSRGLAYFAKRPLNHNEFAWMGAGSCAVGSIDDRLNSEVSHEQIFFEDGKSPANIGFGADGLFSDPSNAGYKCKSAKYDDCLMRKAVANTPPTRPYCLVGQPGKKEKYNCQDWADEVRAEYARLASNPAAVENCKCAKENK